MSIKLKINSIKDRVENGKLILYVPFDIDLKKNINNFPFFDWMKSWGFKYKFDEKLNETKFIMPHSFDLNNVFFKRNQFEYALGFNKTKSKSMADIDFLDFMYLRFLKSMQICKKTVSFANGIQGHKNNKLTEMMYYHLVCNKYENKIDEILYFDELENGEKSYNFLITSLLKSIEKKALILYKKKEELPDLKKNKSFFYLKKINSLNVKSLKKNELKHFVVGFESKFKNYKLAYNSLFGLMFSENCNNIKLDFSNNEDFENSNGVFVTKTLTKLKEMGTLFENTNNFHSNILQFYYLKSYQTANPHFLFSALVGHCKRIKEIYEDDNYDLKDDNVKVFLTSMMEDLILGMKKLGMFVVEE